MQAPPSAGGVQGIPGLQEFDLLSKAYLDYKGGMVSLFRSQPVAYRCSCCRVVAADMLLCCCAATVNAVCAQSPGSVNSKCQLTSLTEKLQKQGISGYVAPACVRWLPTWCWQPQHRSLLRPVLTLCLACCRNNALQLLNGLKQQIGWQVGSSGCLAAICRSIAVAAWYC